MSEYASCKKMAQQHGLGRGLASLIPPKKIQTNQEVVVSTQALSAEVHMVKNESVAGEMMDVSLTDIVPNPHQPRVYFSEDKLTELADSIREHGILQPLIVTKNSENKYELIAGERRFQAAKIAGISKVPVIIRAAANQEKFELAIIENIQRHDLNPMEEARAYRKLMDEFGMSQEAVAKKMGRSRSAIANVVRILQLPIEIQKALSDNQITEGHARALLALSNPEKQRALFEMILKDGLSVREVEAKAKEVSVHSYKRNKTAEPKMKEKEEKLMEIFGTKVKIQQSGKGGKIVIEYYGDEDFDYVMQQLLTQA